jgi:hypothetical protein
MTGRETEMAIRPQLWTLGGLATELQRNVKTIGRALASTPPDGKVGKNDAWLMAPVVKALAPADANGLLGEILRVAKEIDGGLFLMGAEPDHKKRLKMAEEYGPYIGELDDLLSKANRKGDLALSEKQDAVMGPLIGRFAELLGARVG